MTRLISLTVVISVLCALYSPALAAEPAEQLKTAMVRVMEALQDPISREPGRLEERLDQIRGVLKETFDWQEASRLILWRHWGRLTQDERDEFTALFSDVTVRSYLRMIQTYRGEEIAVVLLDEAIDGERAAVRTKLVSKDRSSRSRIGSSGARACGRSTTSRSTASASSRVRNRRSSA
jgi:ABC-type transporter MlaC component